MTGSLVRRFLCFALILPALSMAVPMDAWACGTTNGCLGGKCGVGVKFGFPEILEGPVIFSGPQDDGLGSRWWVLTFRIKRGFECRGGDTAFNTIPMPIGGPGEAMNGCACAFTLPPGADIQAVSFLADGANPNVSTDPAAWMAANPNSTGMAPFVAADAVVESAIAGTQGPNVQAFQSAGPYTINDSFFDIYLLVQTPDTTQPADLVGQGTLGLYGIDDLGGATPNVFPEQDNTDFCSFGSPQIMGFGSFGVVATELLNWGAVKGKY